MQFHLFVRKTVLWFGALLLTTTIGVQAQQAQQIEPQFRFNIDYSRFRYADTLTYVEFYAALPRQQLTFVPDQQRYKAEFKVTAEIFLQDSLVASKIWKNVNYADSLADIDADQSLFCLNHFVMPDGNYEMALQIEDGRNPAIAAHYRFPLPVSAFAGPALQLSDLQISSSISRDTTDTPFVKNGFQVAPNPAGLYGIGLPILYLYSEIYHLAPAASDSGGKYSVGYKIYNADGRMVKEVDAKLRNKPGDSAVEVTGINVVTLVSGAYRVEEEVKDFASGAVAAGSRKFFVYREADFAEGGAAFAAKTGSSGPGSPGVDADRYEVLSLKELDQEFDWARYISSKEERDTYKKLNLDGKRKYIREFWAIRDPSPGTPENEYKRDYLGRIEHANQAFRGTFREGWRSDRGRVLLLYGQPDEIERFPFSNQNRAYETWHYFAVQGGILFYYVDKRDTGDMELVHSTARGEIYDLEWERWIDPNR